jgi:3-oxoacyl-[acyl-carrier-protein] synthase-3
VNAPASILGLGTWLPEHVRGNDAWPASFREARSAGGDRTFNDIPTANDERAAQILACHLDREAADPFLGAKRRHVADAATTADDAETHAAQAALADARVAPEDVDLVISSSMVAERIGPATAVSVAHRIGAERALAFGVDSMCAGALTQLEVARGYLLCGQARLVLLTQSHLMLRTLPMLHPAAPGLGDAASAMVVGAGPGLSLRTSYAATHGEFARSVTWIRGHEDAADPPWWQPGGAFRLGSRSPSQVKQLMRDTVSFGARTLHSALDRAGLRARDIAVLASVQPRGFVPGAIADYLCISPQRAVTTYEEIAHVGACGPVFNLERARRNGLLEPGKIVALYAQGAGFTRAGAVLEVTSR